MSPQILIESILALAVLVFVPWAIWLRAQKDGGADVFLGKAALGGGALAVVSLVFGAETWGAKLLSLPWLLFCLVAAASALKDWRTRFHYFYLPVGGAWLVAARWGIEPIGFSEPIVTLTAVHFHYAAFIAPSLIQMAIRHRGAPKRIFKLCYVGALVSMPVVAAGITAWPRLEFFGAGVFALSLGIFAGAGLWHLPRFGQGRIWQALSLLTIFVTLSLAVAYSLRDVLPVTLDIATMARFHGLGNAIGFAFCGLMAWSFAGLLFDGRPEDLHSRAPSLTLESVPSLFDQDIFKIKISEVSGPAADKLFQLALDKVFRYEVFAPHHLKGMISRQPVQVGDNVLLEIFLPFCRINSPVRVLELVDRQEGDTHWKGFTIITLRGHVEKGVESFLVGQSPEGIFYRIDAKSCPNRWYVWMVYPIARHFQVGYSRGAMQEFKAWAQKQSLS